MAGRDLLHGASVRGRSVVCVSRRTAFNVRGCCYEARGAVMSSHVLSSLDEIDWDGLGLRLGTDPCPIFHALLLCMWAPVCMLRL